MSDGEGRESNAEDEHACGKRVQSGPDLLENDEPGKAEEVVKGKRRTVFATSSNTASTGWTCLAGACEASSQWGGIGLAQLAGRLNLGVGPVDEDSTWSGVTG